MRLIASVSTLLFGGRHNDGLWNRTIAVPICNSVLFTLRRRADRIWVWLGGGHVVAPAKIGGGDHDCGLSSLYWAAPWLPESRIVDAFQFCTENWPYGGVTNKEFQIALKYLNAESHYFADTETLGALLYRQPARCVALLPGHFIAIVNGKIVGRDAQVAWNPSTTVYCHWTFRQRRFRPAENSRRTS